MTLIPQLSSQMMDEIETLRLGEIKEHSVKISTLYVYMRKIETIQALGWFEHTSDWDPYILVVMKDGTRIETESGWAEYHMDNFSDLIDSDSQKLTHIRLVDQLYNEETKESEPRNTEIVIDDIEALVMINQ